MVKKSALAFCCALLFCTGLSRCYAQEQQGFSSIRLTNSEVQLQLSTTSRYRIDLSTNLQLWQPLVSAAPQITGYLDSGALYSSNRFYLVNEYPDTN
ncbi:MAG: hypothetical protein ACXW32_11705, partial [Limisphaerales bacterium]